MFALLRLTVEGRQLVQQKTVLSNGTVLWKQKMFQM